MFQRRMDGSVDFYCNWTDYEQGFGNLSGEFWLGLIHRLAPNNEELRVDLGDFENNTRYAHYDTFSVAGTSDNYHLFVSGYSGTAGDSLAYHSGSQFTTRDEDNDVWNSNCAIRFKGAWWYNNCYASSLNSVYNQDGSYNVSGIN